MAAIISQEHPQALQGLQIDLTSERLLSGQHLLVHPLGEEAIAGASEGCSGRSKPPIDSQASTFGVFARKKFAVPGNQLPLSRQKMYMEKRQKNVSCCMYSTSNTNIILRSTFMYTL